MPLSANRPGRSAKPVCVGSIPTPPPSFCLILCPLDCKTILWHLVPGVGGELATQHRLSRRNRLRPEASFTSLSIASRTGTRT